MTSTFLSSGQGTEPQGVKPWRIVLESYDAVRANPNTFFRAVRLPTLLMVVTVLLALKTYFVCLASYWNSPSVRTASIAISAVVVGVIVSSLLGALATASVARVVRRNSSQLKGMEARMFAAVLRFLAVGFVGLTLIGAISEIAAERVAPGLARFAMWSGCSAALLFIVVLSARCGFLAPALAATERRSVLRGGWSLSAGHFWQITIVWIMLTVAPAAVVQLFGEALIMRVADASVMTLAEGAKRLAADNLVLLLIAISLAIAAILSTVMTTIGSFMLGGRLLEQS